MHAIAQPSVASLRCYYLEAKYECLRLLRTPSFVLPSLLFPPIFYLMFGVLLSGGRNGGDAARYLLASYGVFGIMGPALFGFGVAVALERERGFLDAQARAADAARRLSAGEDGDGDAVRGDHLAAAGHAGGRRSAASRCSRRNGCRCSRSTCSARCRSARWAC